jgi:hypothetical protein
MVATYYFQPGANTPKEAAVMLDGKTIHLTQRDHDDASGWTFDSATPVISFRWVGPTAALLVGAKSSRCAEGAAAPPIPAASNQALTTAQDATAAPADDADAGRVSTGPGANSGITAPPAVPTQPAEQDCDAIKNAFLQMQCRTKQAAAKEP